MNQDLIFQVADLLNKTFTIVNKQERLDVEEQLENLSQDSENYLQALLGIILSPHLSISSQIKSSASIQVNKFANKIDGRSTPSQSILGYIHAIFNTLTNPILDVQLRASLGYSLAPIFSLANDEILTSVFPYILASLDGDLNHVLGSIRAIRSIYNGETQSESLNVYFKHIAEKFIDISKQILEKLKTGQEDLDLAHILIEICGCFTVTFEHFEVVNREFLSEIKDMNKLSQLYSEILLFNPAVNELGDSCLIYISDTLFLIKINNAKIHLLQSINLLLQYLSEIKLKDTTVDKTQALGIDMPESAFLNILQNSLQKITWTLHTIIGLPSYEQLLQKSHISDYFVEALLILNKLATENRFVWFYLQNFKGILIEICFPLLKAFAEDYDNLSNDPEEFVNSSIEIVERQGNDNFKTCTSMLVETLGQYIDGALTFTTNFLIQSSMLSIANVPVDLYTGISEYKNAKIFQMYQEQQLELALMVFCVLSNDILKRNDLLKSLEQYLSTHMKALLDTSSIIVQHRLCLLIKYYAPYIFNDSSDSFSHLIQIVISFSNPDTTNPAVCIQASDSLFTIIKEDKLLIKLNSLIYGIVSSLISLIPSQRSKNFFEILYQITSQNIEVIKPYFAAFVPLLISKIQSELRILKDEQTGEKRKKKTNIVMNNCWNIIRFIAEDENITPAQSLELEQQLYPLFEYLQVPNEIEFEDDIILFEISLIKKCKGVSTAG